jgi:hypothetical protein
MLMALMECVTAIAQESGLSHGHGRTLEGSSGCVIVHPTLSALANGTTKLHTS